MPSQPECPVRARGHSPHNKEHSFEHVQILQLPPRLAYTYTFQFTTVINLNPRYLESGTALVICDANPDLNACAFERYRIPIADGIFPQSLSIR